MENFTFYAVKSQVFGRVLNTSDMYMLGAMFWIIPCVNSV